MLALALALNPDLKPVPLGDIVPNQQVYNKHKDNYRKHRNTFRSDPRASPELQAWRNLDNDYDYQLLNPGGKAFVHASLVGKDSGGPKPWAKADTYFSEYAEHYPRDLILSESDRSYIIGNKASYDCRQYPHAPKDKRPEGQGYCHTLVIPKDRVYNAVDPLATRDHCSVLEELRDHFCKFWSEMKNREAMLARAHAALKERESALIDKGPRPTEYTDAVNKAVFLKFQRMISVFKQLKAEEDFIFGFHVFPDNTIGHLHMHVFPHDNSFREYSTKIYDHKTVPLQAILDVEDEDQRPKSSSSASSSAEPQSTQDESSNGFQAVNQST